VRDHPAATVPPPQSTATSVYPWQLCAGAARPLRWDCAIARVAALLLAGGRYLQLFGLGAREG